MHCQLSFSNPSSADPFSKSKAGIFHSPPPPLFFFTPVIDFTVGKNWPSITTLHFGQGEQFRPITSFTLCLLCPSFHITHLHSPSWQHQHSSTSLFSLRIGTYMFSGTKGGHFFHYRVPQCHSTEVQPTEETAMGRVRSESPTDKMRNFNTPPTHIHTVIPSPSVSLHS